MTDDRQIDNIVDALIWFFPHFERGLLSIVQNSSRQDGTRL
jgi:hypothetical protein